MAHPSHVGNSSLVTLGCTQCCSTRLLMSSSWRLLLNPDFLLLPTVQGSPCLSKRDQPMHTRAPSAHESPGLLSSKAKPLVAFPKQLQIGPLKHRAASQLSIISVNRWLHLELLCFPNSPFFTPSLVGLSHNPDSIFNDDNRARLQPCSSWRLFQNSSAPVTLHDMMAIGCPLFSAP
ncbi:hypothetical protein L7F22_034655 [Adiantum nelumboides]|nr:hypothetical protein [Adiantum nelumboides]